MKIEKISGVSSANHPSSRKNEYDKWASLENFRAEDKKQNVRVEYRNTLGMSQDEYKKRAKEDEELGFGEVLKRNLK